MLVYILKPILFSFFFNVQFLEIIYVYIKESFNLIKYIQSTIRCCHNFLKHMFTLVIL